jgi:hypothetical protein
VALGGLGQGLVSTFTHEKMTQARANPQASLWRSVSVKRARHPPGKRCKRCS